MAIVPLGFAVLFSMGQREGGNLPILRCNELSIREASTHAAFIGAVVDVSAIMPAMAHDSPNTATVDELDDGTYLARGLALPMAGRWFVDVEATRQEAFDTMRFTYDIR